MFKNVTVKKQVGLAGDELAVKYDTGKKINFDKIIKVAAKPLSKKNPKCKSFCQF